VQLRVLDMPDAFGGVPASRPALRLGPWPIWDAVDTAVASLEVEPGRRAVVLLTDGRSTGNVHGLEEVLQRAVRSAVAVSIIGEDSPQVIEQDGGRAARIRPGAGLQWLAENTGGGFTTVAVPAMGVTSGAGVERLIGRAIVRAFAELHHAYTIGFSPTRVDGQWHPVDVRVKRPGVTVRARKAYVAPVPPGG
jgi:Ca-activated chloride channel family protein